MILIIVGLFLFGTVFGSFVCCQVHRLRTSDRSRRSHCMRCDHQLRWYENLPIISWLALKGKCRQCRAKIGATEILSELLLGLAFAAAFIFWPLAPFANPLTAPLSLPDILNFASFVTFLALLTTLAFLFIYDARYGQLPTSPLTISIICATIFLILQQWSFFTVANFSPDILLNHLWSLLAALIPLPALYFLLYKLSREQWVGAGDWLLCLPLAIVLANFWLAFLTLFLANLLGSLASIPLLANPARKSRRHPFFQRIHFGPFLILGFLIVFLAQNQLADLFML